MSQRRSIGAFFAALLGLASVSGGERVGKDGQLGSGMTRMAKSLELRAGAHRPFRLKNRRGVSPASCKPRHGKSKGRGF